MQKNLALRTLHIVEFNRGRGAAAYVYEPPAVWDEGGRFLLAANEKQTREESKWKSMYVMYAVMFMILL